jgi:hypothetical protein
VDKFNPFHLNHRHQNPQPAAAAAIPAVGRGHQNPQPAAAAAPPVRRAPHIRANMRVLNDLFNFVTGVLRSGATIRTFATVAGYTTTYEVQGNSFYNSFLYFYLLIISFFLQVMNLWLATTLLGTMWQTTSARPVPCS